MKIENLLLIGVLFYLWSKRNAALASGGGTIVNPGTVPYYGQPTSVNCTDASGNVYTIPNGPCPPNALQIPPAGVPVGTIITNPGAVDSSLILTNTQYY